LTLAIEQAKVPKSDEDRLTERRDRAIKNWEKAHPNADANQLARNKERNEKEYEDAIEAIKTDIGKAALKSGSGITLKNGDRVFWHKAEGKFKITMAKSTKASKDTTSSTQNMQTLRAPELLKDGDLKKLNGMLPWTMKAQFRVTPKGEQAYDVEFIIGVKTVMHLIHVNDLAEDLRDIISGSQKTLQKVRHKTGEITAVQRFLNLEQIRKDAGKSINGKRWLNTLKRLGEYDKLNGSFFKKPVETIAGGNVPIPNGTLVLTQGNISMLKDETGVDLEQVQHARSLAKTLFLICVCIIDQTAGSMKVFFPDSDTDWDVQSMAHIDAEVAKADNSPLMAEFNKLGRK
jgi:hypothetical protein